MTLIKVFIIRKGKSTTKTERISSVILQTSQSKRNINKAKLILALEPRLYSHRLTV